AITTRSCMTYKEPPIPPPGVEEQEPTEETTDMELPRTEDIQPPLVQVQVQEDKPIEKPSVDVAESSTKNLIPIPHECEVVSKNRSKSIEPVNDNSLVFTTISNSLFDNDKINSDEINSHVESNSNESTSNHDTIKFDYLDEFSGPFIPIYILKEERIRREHADYINRIEMLFTIDPRPHPLTYANTNVESFSSLPIPIQDSDPRQEEIDVVFIMDDVLLPSSEDSDFDNPSVPLPPPEPPDKEFDFKMILEMKFLL
nr:hypothetical protein [Tanacetum cinerariifolium]